MTRTTLFNFGLVLAGVVYVGLVFFQNISSPVMGILLVTVVAYRLIESHRERKRQ